jgi:hypothetical protein
MKTKIILLTIAALFSIAKTQAQTTYYYDKTKTIYGDGYTYQCDVTYAVNLYNSENRLTYAEWTLKDGSPVPDEVFEGEVELMEYETWTYPLFKEIVNRAFSAEERNRVKGVKFLVVMTVDTSTGKITEVLFWFLPDDPFQTIPISVYRQIETELKSQLWFTPTEIGKKLNFVKRGWPHEVGRPKPSATLLPPE